MGERGGGIPAAQMNVSASGSLVGAPGKSPKPAPARLQVCLKSAPGDRGTPLRLESMMKPISDQPNWVSNVAREFIYRLSSQFLFADLGSGQFRRFHALYFPTLTAS